MRTPKDMAEGIIVATEETYKLLPGVLMGGIHDDAATVSRSMLKLLEACKTFVNYYERGELAQFRAAYALLCEAVANAEGKGK